MEKRVIETRKGPTPAGPYSVATALGNLVFVSGLGAVRPETREIVRDSLEAEVRQTLTNLATILEEAGTSLDNVLKVTIYLADLDDWSRMNEVYKEFFPVAPPARACVQAGLLFDTRIEVDAIAYLP